MTKQQLATREEAPPLAITPMDMIAQAINSGAGVEQLGKLMELQERWEKNTARKAFNEAITAAKAEIPAIIRNRTGHNNKRYADFAAIAAVVDPILKKHDLGYRFRSEEGERINVTCILFHRDGHSEETTLFGPADKSGNKNEVQAIGSTLQYLQRYSLNQSLGLASTDDDDGAAGGAEPITTEQAAEILRLIDLYGAEEPKIRAHAAKLAGTGIEKIEDMPARVYDRTVAALTDWARKQRGAS